MNPGEMKERLKMFVSAKKNVVLVIIGIVGVIILILSEYIGSSTNDNKFKNAGEVSCAEYERTLTGDLTELLSAIDGAGEVKVMLTCSSAGEKSYAADENYQSQTETDGSSVSEEKNYVSVENADGSTGGLLRVMTMPEIGGVAVVCSGGGSDRVKNEITRVVCAALGIGASKVYVTKMTAG